MARGNGMKVILTMATSANGIIATKEGSEDFLSEENWKRFVHLAHTIGCFIWGEKSTTLFANGATITCMIWKMSGRLSSHVPDSNQ